MNIKSLFDPIDRLITQAKGYIAEQDARKQYIKQIEDKIEVIRPELVSRKEELVQLVNKIESDEQLRERLQESLDQLNFYLENVELIAEKELALEVLNQEREEDRQSRREKQKKYLDLQIGRLEEQLRNTTNFFEAADFANEIWADYDLFEEFTCEDVVVQLLVDRMNETNTKNTETRIGKDLKKTLEHIRLNLVKSTAWTDEEVQEHQRERDLKLKQLQPVKIPEDRPLHVILLGAGQEMVEELHGFFQLPKKLTIEWIDFSQKGVLEKVFRSPRLDLVVFISLYPEHERFQMIREKLAEKDVPSVNLLSFGAEKLIHVLEDELIRISFQEQFSNK